MIEKNEMDGGTTTVDGRPMRIVLDVNGVYLRTEEMKAPARSKPSALDKASDEARTSQPAALDKVPGAKTTPPTGGDQAGGGFKAGS
jgi:hypothetical protein